MREIANRVVVTYPGIDTTNLTTYLSFIARAESPEREAYGETHHILPKAMFPEFRLKREHPWNQKRLRAQDHFIAHWLLFKLFPDNHQVLCAWRVLWANKYGHLSEDTLQKFAKEYESSKIQHSAYLRSRITSAETRKKMSDAAKQRVVGEETRAHMSRVKQGHVVSEETKKKIGDAQRGIPRGPVAREVVERRAGKIRGRKRPADAVEKTAKAHRGMRRSEEARQHMREASALRWAKPSEREKAVDAAKNRRATTLPPQRQDDEG